MIRGNLLNGLKKLTLHIVFWVFVWLFYIYFFSFNSNNQYYIYWFSALLMPLSIINTYFTIYYLIPHFLIQKRYSIFILYSIYALIGSAFFISISMFFGFVYLSQQNFGEMPPLSKSLAFILFSVYVIVIIVAVFKLLKINYKEMEVRRELEKKIIETKLQLKEDELRFLKMQIQPHFLFNTLNSIYGLALINSKETPEVVLKLSNLLDYILYQIDKPFVLLKDELKHIEDYIALEKIRFTDDLNVKYTKVNGNCNYKIAPMLLLPFVENSFKHGGLIEGVLNVDINVEVKNDILIFRVENSFNSFNESSGGIGLKNIRKRLELLYPDSYNLDVGENAGHYKIELKLNISK